MSIQTFDEQNGRFDDLLAKFCYQRNYLPEKNLSSRTLSFFHHYFVAVVLRFYVRYSYTFVLL